MIGAIPIHLDENSGKDAPDFVVVLAAIILLFSIGWGTYVMRKKKHKELKRRQRR